MPATLFDLALIGAGIVLLYAGGEALVRGAVGLAEKLGLSPLVIGLTVVSFGTSSPELAATLAATLDGASEVAFGNIVGSNIANIALVLGLTASIFPTRGTSTLVRREIPAMILASLLLFWLVTDSSIGRGEGNPHALPPRSLSDLRSPGGLRTTRNGPFDRFGVPSQGGSHGARRYRTPRSSVPTFWSKARGVWRSGSVSATE